MNFRGPGKGCTDGQNKSAEGIVERCKTRSSEESTATPALPCKDTGLRTMLSVVRRFIQPCVKYVVDYCALPCSTLCPSSTVSNKRLWRPSLSPLSPTVYGLAKIESLCSPAILGCPSDTQVSTGNSGNLEGQGRPAKCAVDVPCRERQSRHHAGHGAD